jgi:hypothetical protein
VRLLVTSFALRGGAGRIGVFTEREPSPKFPLISL